MLAKLLTSHRVVSSLHSRRTVSMLQASRPLTGEQTVVPVVARTVTKDGNLWLRVMLPGRPNGSQGWIKQRGTVLITTRWHVVISISQRRLSLYNLRRLVRSFAAIVGKPSTPTPDGQFFVEESITLPSTAAGGPVALALSARSDVLQQFDGGPGQVAIHGLENLGGTLGTAVSHGCIRLGNQDVTWLASLIGPGTPVTIAS